MAIPSYDPADDAVATNPAPRSKLKREAVTRTRAGGRRVTVPKTPAERIAAFRQIVDEKSFAKIDGTTVDLFSASYVVAVYDALSPENRERFAGFPAAKMAAIAFKLAK